MPAGQGSSKLRRRQQQANRVVSSSVRVWLFWVCAHCLPYLLAHILHVPTCL